MGISNYLTAKGFFHGEIDLRAYCHNDYYKKLYKGKGKVVRRFSTGRIIEEIKSIRDNYKVDFIKFGDDLFAARVDNWLKEFLKKYHEEINLPFNCYLRLDMVDDELLSLLSNAGCYSVHLSIDSCSSYVREKILNRKWKKVNINLPLYTLQFCLLIKRLPKFFFKMGLIRN